MAISPLSFNIFIHALQSSSGDFDCSRNVLSTVFLSSCNLVCLRSNNDIIDWIEKLLHTPLDDLRYYCLWRVLVPYLINVRGSSRQEASDIIQAWLAKCNSARRLTFNTRHKVNDVLRRVGSHYPIARADL